MKLVKAIIAGVVLVVGAIGVLVFTHMGERTPQYAGQQNRAVKTLSAEQITGLMTGQGLGYAKSAELNGWPGPLHVLELSQKLELTPWQMNQMHDLRKEMFARAVPLGKELIAAEQELDALFQTKKNNRTGNSGGYTKNRFDRRRTASGTFGGAYKNCTVT